MPHRDRRDRSLRAAAALLTGRPNVQNVSREVWQLSGRIPGRHQHRRHAQPSFLLPRLRLRSSQRPARREPAEEAFAYFGGVFAKLRYDNLGSAVKKVLRGRQREETERWHGFRSHWCFASSYCNVARGNEKGGVEGEGGWYRRNWLVPLPEAVNLEGLNAYLRQGCEDMLARVISGRTVTTGEA